MQQLTADQQWVKLGEGDERPPTLVRNLRTPGGMVIGRVLRAANITTFGAEVFRFGRFQAIGVPAGYDSFDAAMRAVAAAV